MTNRVPHVQRVAQLPRKTIPKQDATSLPRRQTPSAASVLPAWLHGPYAMLAGAAAALLIVALLFTSGWATYSWLAHRSSNPVAEQPDSPVVAPVQVVQAAPVVSVGKPVVTPPPVVQKPPPDPEAAIAPFKRRDHASEDELRKQLLLAPEVSLDSVPKTSTELHSMAERASPRRDSFQGPTLLLAQRPDLRGLPLRMGDDCHLAKEPAEELQKRARQLRVALDRTIPKKGYVSQDDAEDLRKSLLNDSDDWLRGEAVPCLVQILQVESAPVRQVLVDVLGMIDDKRATHALAKRAMTDLSRQVREAAARELDKRPREDYRPLLLDGLRYPWLPVAVHAAETLAFVKDTGAVQQLERMVRDPDPTLPFLVPQGETDRPTIREVVRINHLSNCLLCHPGSFAGTDLVRGAVPEPGKPLPSPLNSPQYYDNGTILVRADTTYLRQDFSVVQTVADRNQWPEEQRFDYLVRTRPATLQEMQFLALHKLDDKQTPWRKALLFALEEITDKGYALDGTPLLSRP